ncbi:hypothetical protein P7K49_010341, partial [Saguinus oedipus]
AAERKVCVVGGGGARPRASLDARQRQAGPGSGRWRTTSASSPPRVSPPPARCGAQPRASPPGGAGARPCCSPPGLPRCPHPPRPPTGLLTFGTWEPPAGGARGRGRAGWGRRSSPPR